MANIILATKKFVEETVGALSNLTTTAKTNIVAAINELVSGKVDKVTGKGLSANDFTNEYKTAVDNAAPQATTYTKTETDNLLDEKLDADAQAVDSNKLGGQLPEHYAPQETTYTKDETDYLLGIKMDVSPIYIIHSDGTQTPYFPVSDTDVARGTALLSALSEAVSNDVIYLSSGTFDIETTTALIPENVTLKGTGKYTTKISSSKYTESGQANFRASNNSVISDLWLENRLLNGEYQYGLRATLNADVYLYRVYITGDSDAITVDLTSNWHIYDCELYSHYDTFNFFNTVENSCFVEMYNTKLTVETGSVGTQSTILRAFNYQRVLGHYYDITLKLYNCIITANNTAETPEAYTVGVRGINGNLAEIHNCKFAVSHIDENVKSGDISLTNGVLVSNCVGSGENGILTKADGSAEPTYVGVISYAEKGAASGVGTISTDGFQTHEEIFVRQTTLVAAGSAVNVTGLDLDTHKRYKGVFALPLSVDTNARIYVNGDTIPANYYGRAFGGGYEASNQLIGTTQAANNGYLQGDMDIWVDHNGRCFVRTTTYVGNDSALLSTYGATWYYYTTVTNITQIGIYSLTANAFKIGAFLRISKA